GRAPRPGSAQTRAASPAAVARAPRGETASCRGRMSQRHATTAAPGLRPVSPSAISCNTRPSSAGSICTGRRRWLTIRSTGSCRSSNTFRLTENDLQLLAVAFHPHLQRRNPRARQLRHLLVLQVLDVLEEERFPVFRGEPAERPADGVVPLGALGRTGQRHTAERRVVAHEQPRASRGAPARRAAPVHEDAVPSLVPASGGRVTRSTGGRVSPDRAVTVPVTQRSADDSLRVAPAGRGPPLRSQLLQGRYHIPPQREVARPRAAHRCAVPL